jgi:hypothetical protein
MEFCSDFRFDLLVGNEVEGQLGLILNGKRIEVKSDKLAHKSLNVFVEYESRGKRSGISTTQADYYCFEVQGTFILISVPRLKIIARKYIGTKRDIRGGGENTSKGILLPIVDLLSEQCRCF